MDRMACICVLFMTSSALDSSLNQLGGGKELSGVGIKPMSVSSLKQLVHEQINNPAKVSKNSCEPNCPYGWAKFDGRCFAYFGSEMDWAAAEAHCINLGGNLVSVHSENEYQMVKALIRIYDPTEKATWIGLSDCQKKNSWVWSDGSRYGYSKWNPKEPNHKPGECCVHINFSSQKNWNDIPCKNKYPFVCVRRL